MKLPFDISPSVSDLILHSEESGNTTIEFVAWYKDENKYEVVCFNFHRCVGSRCSGMVGEGKGEESIGVVRDSNWLKQLKECQNEYYPEYPDNFNDVSHYYFRGHDVTVEILAEGFEYKTIRELEGW